MIHYNKIFDDSDIFDCLSGAISTLCAYYKYPYEPIFSQNNYFDFERNPKSDLDLIGGRIKSNSNFLYILEKYLKIKVNRNHIPSNEAEIFIQTQIKDQKPFIIFYDAFYAPWLPDYKELHSAHTSIVEDFTMKSEIICIDTFPAGRNLVFPMEDWNTSEPEFITLDFTIKPDQSTVFKMFSDGLQTLFEKESSFDNIRNYAQLLYTDFDLKKENNYKNEKYWVNSKFFRDLLTIARERRSYSVFLSYMQGSCKQLKISPFIDEFITLSKEWRQVVLILWKQCMKNKNEGINLFLRDTLLEFADKEEALFSKLFDFMMREKDNY